MPLAANGFSHYEPDANAARMGVQLPSPRLGGGLEPHFESASPQAQSIPPSKGYLDAFVKTCQRWHLSLDEQIVLLGFKCPSEDFLIPENHL
jgi:hypothetical protein